MTIKRIKDLPENSSSLTNDDIFIFMDDPSGQGTTKKVSLSELSSAIGGGSSFDAAVEWTSNHTLIDGTRYLANDLVYSGGNLYKANYDNESEPVTNTTYWTNLGPGYRLNIDGRDIPNIPTISTDPVVVNVGSVSGAIDTDVSSGQIFDMVLTDAITLNNPLNPINGASIRWRITQDGSGNRAVTLGDKFVTPSSSIPIVFSTASGATDLLAATYHAGRDKWDIVAFITGY